VWAEALAADVLAVRVRARAAMVVLAEPASRSVPLQVGPLDDERVARAVPAAEEAEAARVHPRHHHHQALPRCRR